MLAGWVTGVASLYRVASPLPDAPASVAVACVLLGAAALAHAPGRRAFLSRGLALATATACATGVFVGPASPLSQLAIAALALCLILVDGHGRRRAAIWAGTLVIPAAALLFAVIGHIYRVPAFYGPGQVEGMALPALVAMSALLLGLVFARVDRLPARWLLASGPAGTMARRLMPVVLAGPAAVGGIELAAHKLGVFGERAGSAWLALALTLLLGGIVADQVRRMARADAERRRLEDELRYSAERDSLTGLANRRLFTRRLNQALALAERGVRCALLIIDLDNFKHFNDRLGHAAGDRILVDTARVLGLSLREIDLAARLGGDEFAVILPTASRDGAERVAARVRDGLPPGVSASIGISAVAPGERPTMDAVLAEADSAMYAEKRGQRKRRPRAYTPASPAYSS